MTDYSKRDETETKAHKLIAECPVKWSPEVQMVRNTFLAQHQYAFTLEKIERIAAALHSYEKVDLQAALTAMVRAKTLRSYVKEGKRRYELNY